CVICRGDVVVDNVAYADGFADGRAACRIRQRHIEEFRWVERGVGVDDDREELRGVLGVEVQRAGLGDIVFARRGAVRTGPVGGSVANIDIRGAAGAVYREVQDLGAVVAFVDLSVTDRD